mmetsp:Transcript_25803/g.63488  ORF Transcript_25803/g.63488 Transcript_25803/m.63488 type:complete len:83 (-) Transcript_25803:97-345(-)
MVPANAFVLRMLNREAAAVFLTPASHHAAPPKPWLSEHAVLSLGCEEEKGVQVGVMMSGDGKNVCQPGFRHPLFAAPAEGEE